MTFDEAWIEHDYNPFIVFNEEGRISSLNQEAQYLLGEVENKEIFELTQAYASHTYGFKTTSLDLSFGSYKFYAITVGYLDEKKIGIKLYKVASKKFTNIEEYGDSVNIYALLDLCISAASTRSKSNFSKEFDPTFPDIRLKINNFTKLLNKIYQSHLAATSIRTKLSLVTGEYIRFENKKYPIFTVKILTNSRDSTFEKDIEEIASKSNTVVRFHENNTTISTAMVAC
ncbi:hypothetical protein [Sulfurospirillum arcachonense]|uniref:hypothetical protein n=1 Tax=Sulfurospirillum arcachonense TaxID=57666 RepID=UPI000468D0AF|nr:hypothetical protein [Sulfurospirillum arcachonense]